MNETKAEEEVTVAKLAQDFKVVIRDAEALMRATAGDLGEKAREARNRLATSLESAQAGFSRVEDQAIASAKATDKVIREHPYESIGVAFGLGLLIGVLVARK
jgi:ElaB/YqjD/DUF883 family membrane-anchored ribosome-binding protein